MSVFVYDYNPVIYALARVRPPTPYILNVELTQYSHSSKVDGVAEIRRVMDTLPNFVILGPSLAGKQSLVALDDVMALRLATYHLAHEIVDKVDNRVVRIYKK